MSQEELLVQHALMNMRNSVNVLCSLKGSAYNILRHEENVLDIDCAKEALEDLLKGLQFAVIKGKSL